VAVWAEIKQSNNIDEIGVCRMKRPKSRRGGTRPGAGRKALPRLDKVVAVAINGNIAEAARTYAAEAIGTLVGVMRDSAATDAVRVGCACKILELASKADGSPEHAGDTRQVSDLDLARWILSVFEGAAQEADRLPRADPRGVENHKTLNNQINLQTGT